MVVISIIGLLSSIVLASLKDARDKATMAKFTSEINQFKNALELYKSEIGTYPYEGSLVISRVLNDNSDAGFGTPSLSTVLSKYMKTLPQVPKNSYSATGYAWEFIVNPPAPNTPSWRCEGDVSMPKYVILFYNTNPAIFNNYFNSLPGTEVYFGSWGASSPTAPRCFSLK